MLKLILVESTRKCLSYRRSGKKQFFQGSVNLMRQYSNMGKHNIEGRGLLGSFASFLARKELGAYESEMIYVK
jgi:hypothetical protein